MEATLPQKRARKKKNMPGEMSHHEMGKDDADRA